MRMTRPLTTRLAPVLAAVAIATAVRGENLEDLSQWKLQAWKGSGQGRFDTTVHELVLQGGGEAMDNTVAVVYEAPLNIPRDGYCRFSAKLKGEDVTSSVILCAAIRSGGLKDLNSRKLTGTFDWQDVSVLIHPPEEVKQATYLAIRLFGPGKVRVKDITVRPLDKQTAEALAEKEAAELKLDREQRIGKLMRSYQPTLPLADENAERQFRIWGTERPDYTPVPDGWKEVGRPAEEYPWEAAVIPAGASEKGYVVFSRPTLEPVGLDTQPRRQDLATPLRAFATPGEFEPIAFSVRALRDLTGARVTLTDLEGPSGAIGAPQLDIRTQGFIRIVKDRARKRFYHEPFLLEKGPDFIDANSTRRYWITVKVPEDAQPGVYRGEVSFAATGVEPTRIPIHFRVLPFRLPELDVSLTVWWHGERYKRSYPREHELIDQREHGMTTFVGETSVPNRDGKVDDRDIKTMAERIDEHVKWHKQFGFTKPMIGGHSNHYIVFKWDRKINWFRMDPKSDALDQEFLSVYRRLYMEEGKQRGWPDIWHYVFDEPGGARPEILPDAAHYLQLLEATYPELKTFVTFGGGLAQGYDEIEIIGRHTDYWSLNRHNPELAARIREHGREIFVYNGGTATFNGPKLETRRNRFFYGVYAEKIEAAAVGQWTYAFEKPFAVPFAGNHGYVYPGDDGPIPSSYWEAIREGVDDRRYLRALKDRIKAAKDANAVEQRTAAKQAEQLVDGIMAQVSNRYQTGRDTPESRIDHFDYGIFDRWRWAIADQIMKLDGSERGNVEAEQKAKQSKQMTAHYFAVESQEADPFPLPEKRTGKVYVLTSPPKIDGKMDPGEWDAAGLLDDFTYAKFVLQGAQAKRGYQAAPLGQRVRVGYDRQNLYLAFENPLPKGAQPKTLAQYNDGQVWADDSVEFFIKPGMGPSPYWVMISNSAGKWLDGKERDIAWNGQWSTAAGVQEGKWVCEIEFPWKNLDLQPEQGARMLMNFYRSDHPNGKYACWSPVKEGPHEPESFGIIELAGAKSPEPEIVRLSGPPALQQGENKFVCSVRDPGAGRLTLELNRDGEVVDTCERNPGAEDGPVVLELPIEFEHRGLHQLNVRLSGERLDVARSFTIDFASRRPLEIILQKPLILSTDRIFTCKVIAHAEALTGQVLTFRILSNTDAKELFRQDFTMEKAGALLEVDVGNWIAGTYQCLVTGSGSPATRAEQTLSVVNGF